MECVCRLYGMLKRWTVLSKFETCTVIDEKKRTLFEKWICVCQGMRIHSDVLLV